MTKLRAENSALQQQITELSVPASIGSATTVVFTTCVPTNLPSVCVAGFFAMYSTLTDVSIPQPVPAVPDPLVSDSISPSNPVAATHPSLLASIPSSF